MTEGPLPSAPSPRMVPSSTSLRGHRVRCPASERKTDRTLHHELLAATAPEPVVHCCPKACRGQLAGTEPLPFMRGLSPGLASQDFSPRSEESAYLFHCRTV